MTCALPSPSSDMTQYESILIIFSHVERKDFLGRAAEGVEVSRLLSTSLLSSRVSPKLVNLSGVLCPSLPYTFLHYLVLFLLFFLPSPPHSISHCHPSRLPFQLPLSVSFTSAPHILFSFQVRLTLHVILSATIPSDTRTFSSISLLHNFPFRVYPQTRSGKSSPSFPSTLPRFSVV